MYILITISSFYGIFPTFISISLLSFYVNITAEFPEAKASSYISLDFSLGINFVSIYLSLKIISTFEITILFLIHS